MRSPIVYLVASLFTLLLSPAVQAHPGHQHDPGLLAGLAHALMVWSPLLLTVVIAGAVLALRARSGRRD